MHFSKSLFMHVYPVGYRFFGIPPETMMPIVVGVAIAVMALGAYALTRALLPGSPKIVATAVILLACVSSARNMSVARFGAPPGPLELFYAPADALRLWAIASVLGGGSLLPAVLLAASFATHPIMGLMGAVFVFVMRAIAPRELVQRRTLVSMAVFLSLAGIWALVMFERSSGKASVPVDDWFALTRLNNYHWYPVDVGLFTRTHEQRFLPFMSFMILFVYYFGRKWPWGRLEWAVLAGLSAMMFLTIAGVVISVWRPRPFWVKLALHRAHSLMIWVALVYVVDGLWNEIAHGAAWRRVVAALVLVSPFLLVYRPGFPLLWSVLIVSPSLRSFVKARGRQSVPHLVVPLLVLGIAAILLVYARTGMIGKWDSGAYTGAKGLWEFIFWGPGLLFVLLLFRPRARTIFYPLVLASVILPLALASARWARSKRPGEEHLERASAYKDAQLWARGRTTKGSLFMTDPTIYYGWRDYSRRSSFGNLREWLHSGWLYDSDLEGYKRGMERFLEFGVELGPYLKMGGLDGIRALTPAIRSRYYSQGSEWMASLARKYGIDYFIFDRRYLVRTVPMPVAFSNEGFIVGKWEEGFQESPLCPVERIPLSLGHLEVPFVLRKSSELKKKAGFIVRGVSGEFEIEPVQDVPGAVRFKALKPGIDGRLAIYPGFLPELPGKLDPMGVLALEVEAQYSGGKARLFIQQKVGKNRRNRLPMPVRERKKSRIEVYSYENVEEIRFGLSWFPSAPGDTLELYGVAAGYCRPGDQGRTSAE